MNTKNKFAVERIQNEYLYQVKQYPNNKYVMLYRSIKQCILNTELPNDWVLPSTRILSEELDLSRTTIIKAYELLSLEKLIVSKVGSGNRISSESWVRKNGKKNIASKINCNDYPKISRKGLSYLNNISLINRLPNENIAFRPGLPPLDVFPVNKWKNLLNTYWRHVKSSSLSYSQTTGLNELKNSVCNYLNISRKIKCSPDQIIIVSGSLQSLYLISNTLIDEGDCVVLENPVFPNVHSVFKSIGADIVPVGVDREGVSLRSLKSINNKKPKLIHVTPSNHYPLGIKMSLERRKEILSWASKHKALIIENDYENEIANTTDQTPSIYSIDTEDRTIYMGTFNRLLHPSIRLAYMVVPSYLVETVQALQEHSHRFVSPSIQVVMNQFIEKNYLFQHIKSSVQVAKERYELFCLEFNACCKTMYVEKLPFSSFHLVAYFKKEITPGQESKIIVKLNQNKITAFSLSKCYIGIPEKFGLIIGYSSVRSSIMKRKIKKMTELVDCELLG
ncbi:MocR-like pyridoxine biosynthesis transcription factor PdxR [Mangrovimonas aestuarii]|uniref:MocR-like pyridoxine biosynthesis transcription factor PdxR n=1 Tax=Mangrovimonas aestuarii TaxID=3018443 RepID=UPI0023786518|nr:PLP-dependent aminotransferase family protein [Mangrovimonas aestuarii]